MTISSTDFRVLVSGGGTAGNAVAVQLARAGLATTVVERFPARRSGGQVVDLRGPGRRAAELMGLSRALRPHLLPGGGITYLRPDGRVAARIPAARRPRADSTELPRGDLNNVLLTEVERLDRIDYRYGDSISGIVQDDAGVDVYFDSGGAERFSIVIGAEGVYSPLRRMVFGPHEQFTTFLDGYMSFFTMATPEHCPAVRNEVVRCLLPSAAHIDIRVETAPGESMVTVGLRQPHDPALRGNPPAQRRLVSQRLAAGGRPARAIVAGMSLDPGFYLDQLVRVDLPRWSRGRVVLLGDAACCGSPLTGQGTAQAMVGAYVLAGEIAATPDDVAGAFDRYERVLRPHSTTAQQIARGQWRALTPGSELGRRAGLWRQLRRAGSAVPADGYLVPEYPREPALAARNIYTPA
ncbi:FAD-dependent monooxygenase [Nocardia sp. NPDC051030]|uniref:FAD-dependent monooxygenase n=1 Tax=Nocardia sp. NPDC051030 TaxID=3155162 RepID=UPI003433E89F